MTRDDADVHKIVLTPADLTAHTAATVVTADCGHQAWIAPSSKAVVDNPLIRTATVCIRCVDLDELRAGLTAQGGLLALPGTRAAVSAVLGVAETDQIWSRYRVREYDPQGQEER